MFRLFRYLKPYRLPIALVLLFTLGQTITDLLLPTLMAHIVDNGIAGRDLSVIQSTGALMVGITAVGVVCSIAGSYFSASVSEGFGRDMRERVFSRVTSFSVHTFDTLGTASLITRTAADISQVQGTLLMMLRLLVMAPMMFLGGLVMAISVDSKLSVLLLVIAPLLAGAIALIFIKATPLFRVIQKKVDHLNLVVRENLNGIRVIRAFNRIPHERARYEAASRDLTETSLRVGKIMAFMMPVIMSAFNFSSLAILWFGSIRIHEGTLQVGVLMAFLQYAFLILFGLLMMSMIFANLPRAAVSAGRIQEVLEAPQEEDAGLQGDLPHAERLELTFDNVSFRYPGAERQALERVSFRTRAGEVTAIIGGTGSGKSTLLNLIPRFYEASEGAIRLNGCDIRELPQQTLRQRIGLVPQRSVLFSGTVAGNIRFGYEAATEEEVRHAARVAQAEPFILEMKEGYETVLAQGGTNVSGGQRQRISIARSLVRKPKIHLFDESFSALDYKTDAALRKALRGEIADAVVLIVAQRVSTVKDADRIIVLDDGRVAGIGTHQELLESCEVYREITESQHTEEETA